nr:DEAD-box ATP-dependent RNA helicase 21 [Tanacetum cinerariifolium]
MKRSIDDLNNTILHANKKPAYRSSPTPREQRHDRRDKVRKEHNTILHANKKHAFISNPTPREQRRDKRVKKHAKKREREVEVESIKEVQSFRTTGSGVESSLNNKLLKATPSPIHMAAIPLGSQQSDVIGVAETGSVPVGNLYVLLLVRLIVPVDARSLYLTIDLIVVPVILFFSLASQSLVNFFPIIQAVYQ